jgi:hypothetical protein
MCHCMPCCRLEIGQTAVAQLHAGGAKIASCAPVCKSYLHLCCAPVSPQPPKEQLNNQQFVCGLHHSIASLDLDQC